MVELPVSPAPWPLHHLTFLVPSIPLPAPSMFSPSLKGWLSPEFQLLSCILSMTGPSSTSQLQLLIPFTQSRTPWTSLIFCWTSLCGFLQTSQINDDPTHLYLSLYMLLLYSPLGYWYPFESPKLEIWSTSWMPFPHQLIPKFHIQLSIKLGCLSNSSLFCSFLLLTSLFRFSSSLIWTCTCLLSVYLPEWPI